MRFETMGAAARRCAIGGLLVLLAASGAGATPYLVVDAASGATLIQNQATEPWYPASLTKLMTTYVALDAVRQGRLTLDTPLTMSPRAAAQAPSKMGFAPGTQVTLDNALKMLMVKSPNDVAVMVAENISGSVEDFAAEMNAEAEKLGMRESHFVNPNGLHDPDHYSSARDMAIVARALLTEFPERADLFDIGAMEYDGAIIPNHNHLLGRYPGADGMKTGFTCSAGFNVVASATHDGRKLIVVVLGAPNTNARTLEAAQLFERGFGQTGAGPELAELPKSAVASPRDMRSDVCMRRTKAQIEAAEEEVYGTPTPEATAVAAAQTGKTRGLVVASAAATTVPPQALLTRGPIHYEPVHVFTGPKPGWTGEALVPHGYTPPPAAEPKPEAKPAALASDAKAAPEPPKKHEAIRKPHPRRPKPKAADDDDN